MDAKELMIGDWILENIDEEGFQAPCCWVTHRVNAYDFKFWLENNWVNADDKAFSEFWLPIPLTPEILENNYFKKCVVTNGTKIDKKFNPYHITEQLYIHDEMCGTIACCSDGGSKLNPLFECKYVHQLQHILKLSGILNEIVL